MSQEETLQRRVELAEKSERTNVSLHLKLTLWQLVQATALEVCDETEFDRASHVIELYERAIWG